MKEKLTLEFKIKRFLSSNDKDFIEALKIYNKNVSIFVKTSCNEITYYVDNPSCDTNREMYFFGLYVNDGIAGFLEAGYMKKSKSIVVDYLILKDEYRLNGVFYPIFSLILNYFSENIVDYDFILLEIMESALDGGDDTDYFYKKMLSIEDFQVIDELYRHPMLGKESYESNNDCKLLIKSVKSINNLHKDTYLKVINDIYYSHYYDWYKKFLNSSEAKAYKNHLDSQLKITIDSIGYKDIISVSNIKLVSCQFYKEDHCCYKSTSGYITQKKTKKNTIWVVGTVSSLVISIVLSILLRVGLTHFNVPMDIFTPLFSCLLVFFSSILVLYIKTK